MSRRLSHSLISNHARCLCIMRSWATPAPCNAPVCYPGLEGAVVARRGVANAVIRQNKSIWEAWPAFLGFAAAATVLGSLPGCTATADAIPPAGDDQAWQSAAVSAAERAVNEAWQEAVLDWQRSDAQHSSSPTTNGARESHHQQPAGSTTSSSSAGSSSSSSRQRPKPPKVTLQDSTHVTVTIPLVEGLDLHSLLSVIDSGMDTLALRSSSASQQQQSWMLSTQKVLKWDISRVSCPFHADNAGQITSKAGASSSSSSTGRQQLSVQVVVPLQSSSPHESSSSNSSSSNSRCGQEDERCSSSSWGIISVAKAGPFAADELELLGKLVTAANKPATGLAPHGAQHQDSHLWGLSTGSRWQEAPTDKLLDGLESLSGALLGRIFAEMLHEFQEGFDSDGTDGDEDVWERLRWEDMMGQLFGSLGERLGDSMGRQLPDDVEQQIRQLQQQIHAMTPPDVIEWLHRTTDPHEQQQQQERQEGDAELHETQQQQQQQYSGGSASSRTGQYRSDRSSSSKSQVSGPQQQQQQEELHPWELPSAKAAVKQLEQLGAAVYMPTAAALQPVKDQGGLEDGQQWGVLAGYEAQKQALEDCLLLPLKHPEVYDRVSAGTRRTAKSAGARPRAVLFEGPPGTGKTSTARVLAGRASLPLVYIPLEMLVSKWYGESEQNMAKIFKACEALGGCIIFLDELDSLATSRDQGDMHEASRRMLGVLLREIDGFSHRDSSSSGSDGGGGSSSRRSVVIGATNRRQDLDAALLSRFDLSIHFGLPDEPCRAAILQQYAHQLSEDDRDKIAAVTAGFSGRDLRDVCEQTERTWASKIIRGQVEPEKLPALDDYLAAVKQRREGAGRSAAAAAAGGPGRHPAWPFNNSGSVYQM